MPLKEAKKEDAVDPIAGGAKELATRAADTPQIKDPAVALAKQVAEPIWNNAGTGDKAAIVTGGAAIVGTGLGAMLSDPSGRKALSGLPIGAPLSLVPYAVFSGFSFDVPKTASDPLLLHLSFKGDDYLDLLRTKYPSFPKMTLSFDMTLSVSPDHKVTMPFGLVKLSPLPGVTLAGGLRRGKRSAEPDLLARRRCAGTLQVLSDAGHRRAARGGGRLHFDRLREDRRAPLDHCAADPRHRAAEPMIPSPSFMNLIGLRQNFTPSSSP